jgi:hypothetical protein
MAPGPVRWPWIASSVPIETFPAGVRFRGWMSEAEGFLCFRLLASLTWPPRPGPMPLTQSLLSWPLPSSRVSPRPACAPRPILSSHWYLGFLASRQAAASLKPRATDSTHVSDGQGARLPSSGPAGVPRSRVVRPGRCTPSPDARPGRCTPSPDARPGRRTPSPGRPARPTYPSPGRADLGGARGVLVRAGWAGSWQRIDGVSRLLPYSDLLALTSSSRRGEGVSDRGSWKRLRILPTGHVDAHVEPDIETGAVLIGPAWCLDR